MERRLLLRTTDLLEVEGALDALEAAGIEAFERVDTSVAGILGSTGQEFLIEVAANDLTKAATVLDQARNESAPAAEAAPPSGAKDESPKQVDQVAFAAWRLASKVALGSSFALLVLGVLAGQTLPHQVFGSAIFDFLIWRGFTSDDLTEPGAKRLRSFGFMRGIGGLAVGLLFLSTGGGFAWLAAGAQVLIVALYARSSEPTSASQADEPTRS
jgi:hypothetical protein